MPELGLEDQLILKAKRGPEEGLSLAGLGTWEVDLKEEQGAMLEAWRTALNGTWEVELSVAWRVG